MRFSAAFVPLALFAGSALASPVEVPAATIETHDSVEIPESVKNATALGIDLYGKVPSDAVRVDDHWTAEEGTLANAYFRAQIDLPAYEEQLEAAGVKLKRQNWANIGIGLWAQDNCQGQATYFDNVQYGWHHVSNINNFAVGISYRGLRRGEHLDFSRLRGSDRCGEYVTNILGPTGTGCGHIPATNCFRLWYE
ncbi:hypothetical protein QBC38DRAFT_264494 [Podospora fimiseda]|uniref:Ecp2 effector protein domain-containing protein n=1 Tax=Podospora fimiseda TaxID=252190 RepID=A0AAN7BLD3_9PEZI|nr:hypothetical protein QBC38DRAFT_264494 [Podospora fimiseda]